MRLSLRLAAPFAATVLSAAGLLAGTAQPAYACPSSEFYDVRGSATHVPFKDLPTFKDGRGGTISVTKDFTKTSSYQVTAGAESEVGAVLAKAKVSISASLTKTNSSTVTHNYSHKISPNKYGHAQYVSWGKTVHWKKYRYNYSCQQMLISSGTIKYPSNSEGWRYWETAN